MPSAFALILSTLFFALEAWIIGSFCPPGSLAIIAIYYPLQTFVMAIASGIGVGAGSYISRKLGESDSDEVVRTASAAFGVAFFVGLFFALMSLFFPNRLFFLSGGLGINSLSQESVDYIRVIGFSLLFFPVTVVTLNLMRSEGAHKKAFFMLSCGLFVNLIFLVVFVPFYGFGLRGVAVATLIGRAITFLFSLGYFKFFSSRLSLKFQYFFPARKLIWEILRIGISAFLMGALGAISALFLNWLLGRGGGQNSLALLGVFYRILSIVLLPSFAVIQGIQPVLGYYYGAGNKTGVRRVFTAAAVSSFFLTALFIIPGVIWSEFPIRFFSKNLNLVQGNSNPLIPILISALFVSLYNLLGAFYQAVGDALPAFIQPLLRQIILFIPLSALFFIFGGIEKIWLAWPVSDGLAFIIMIIIYSILLYRKKN